MLPKASAGRLSAILKGSEMNKTALRVGAGALALASVSSFAALDAAITSGVGGAVADILLVIALGGAAFVTIASGGVVWNVAAKFIKRLGPKA
jgi:H+/gluconate symporter-like permease